MVNCILLIEMAEQRRLGFYFFFNWLKMCFSKIIQNLRFPSSITEWIKQLWSCSSWAEEGRKNAPIASFVFHLSRQRLKPMCEISESPTNLVWKPLAKKMNVHGCFVSNGGEGGQVPFPPSEVFCLFLFLAMPPSLWDVRSPTGYWALPFGSESMEP